MAKSTSFFGLRRGSTKSLTFQVLDGKQVTKDRVSVVKNPKTSRQAVQRAKLLPAIRFMAIFGGIVDHSFENVAYGQKSKQHFLSLAMKTQPTNPMLKGQLGWYPQAYTISQGSLPSMNAVRTGGPSIEISGLTGADWDESLTWYDNFVQNNPIIQEGDQITVIAVTEAGAGADDRIYCAMKYDRVIVDRLNFDNAEQGLVTQNRMFCISTDNDKVVAQALIDESSNIVAGAVILSRRTSNKWLRSTEVMFSDFLGYVTWDDSVATYMTAASELASPWYLNAADNSVISEDTANNGEWVPMLLAAAASPGSDAKVYLGAKNNLYGNFAFVTKSGRWNDVLPNVALSSSLQLQNVTLANFNYDAGDTAETIAGRDTLKYAGALGSTALTAMPDEQPNELVALAKVQ